MATIIDTDVMQSTVKPRLQILYVHKGSPHHHEHIETIGGRNPDGSVWRMSEQQAIDEIAAGRLDFFVHTAGKVVEVVPIPKKGSTYLRTEGDDSKCDNLLSLSDFPWPG